MRGIKTHNALLTNSDMNFGCMPSNPVANQRREVCLGDECLLSNHQALSANGCMNAGCMLLNLCSNKSLTGALPHAACRALRVSHICRGGLGGSSLLTCVEPSGVPMQGASQL